MYTAPGNPGIATVAQLAPVAANDIQGIVDLADQLRPGMVVVGPEAPLAMGAVDALAARGHAAFGPTRAAARIEWSKAFAKELMMRAGVPTARYEVYEDPEEAQAAASSWGGPVVVKLDGLAAGKGVIVADSPADGVEAVRELAAYSAQAAPGGAAHGAPRFILEEKLEGYEVSVFGISDGRHVVPLVPAQDHKRAYDGDEGPNTGGMGAVAPVPRLSAEEFATIASTVLEPAIRQLADEGIPFVGTLFAGLMITAEGPKVLEFNCRFGDPETQAVLPLMRADFAELVEAACRGGLDGMTVEFERKYSACVVMAASGYPERVVTGQPIVLPDAAALGDDTLLFHAGTALREGQLVTAGGRVLAVTAIGDDLEEARGRAYSAVHRIQFDGAHFRTDIGRAATG